MSTKIKNHTKKLTNTPSIFAYSNIRPPQSMLTYCVQVPTGPTWSSPAASRHPSPGSSRCRPGCWRRLSPAPAPTSAKCVGSTVPRSAWRPAMPPGQRLTCLSMAARTSTTPFSIPASPLPSSGAELTLPRRRASSPALWRGRGRCSTSTRTAGCLPHWADATT